MDTWTDSAVVIENWVDLAQVLVPCLPVLHMRRPEPGPTLHIKDDKLIDFDLDDNGDMRWS